ncbi:MAG TPA: acyl-CoA thioesterase [Nitrospirae bacterium]|nr:acyl-CoA thioesterase [Nitrospirota bacterium]
MSEEYPKDRAPITRVLTMPSNANATGDIFGGWILAQVDIAGAILAAERAQGRIVTVAVNSVHFRKPVFVGDVVSFFCEILKIGNTSMTVLVEVFAERIPGVKDKVTEAEVVYVAVDESRRPRPVPPSG